MADDREVWQKISQGDAAIFGAFYREHAPRLQAFLRQIVGSHQAAEDVAQETFTQLWNRPTGFDPERGPLRAYLYGVARKRAADWWRRQRPTDATGEDGMAASNAVSSSTEPGTAELRSVMGDAFRRLSEEQRTLLWLREVEGQSYAELAATLGVPVGTVRSRLFTAREALRTIWHSTR